MKKLLLTCAAALMAVGSAWATDVEETYDFQAWGQAHMDRNTYATINFAATSDFQVENVDIYTINSIVSAKDANVWELPSRIAASNNITLRWGRGGSDYPRLGTENAGDKYISIINLNAGDEVRFNNVTASFVSTNVTWLDGETPTSVTAGDAVVANTVYTLTENGHVDLKVTGWGNIRQIYVTRHLSSEEVSKPTLELTGTNGINRSVTITPGVSTLGNSVQTYYTTDGTDPTSVSSLYNAPVEVSSSCTIKAVSISSEGISSSIASLDVAAGTLIKLNNPTLVCSHIDKAGSLYNFTYTFACDNSTILGNPIATYSYSFNGGTPTDANEYVESEKGTLTVTAHADGYADAVAEFNVGPKVTTLWVDYTDEDYNISGLGTGMRKWSGDTHWTFEHGFGYRASRLEGETKKNSWFQISKNGPVAYTVKTGENENLITIANNVAAGNENLNNVAYDSYLTALYTFEIVSATVTLGKGGYSTFAADYDYTVSGTTVYTVSLNAEKTEATLNPVAAGTIIPANEGIVLGGSEGDEAYICKSATTGSALTNDLVGFTTQTALNHSTNTYYVLSTPAEKETGFYRYTGTNMPAGKAALVVDGAYDSNAAVIRVNFEGMEDGYQTAISLTPSLSEGEGACYDLYGRKSNGKGLMIQNGKVVLVK